MRAESRRSRRNHEPLILMIDNLLDLLLNERLTSCSII
jgi:hypothetical protein